MRKTLVTIFAIAILGALGLYANNHKSNSTSAEPSSSNSTTNSVAGDKTSTTAQGNYKDGTYTGSAADTPYGAVQVAAVVSGGKITNINFIKMPHDEGRSVEITNMSEPMLKQTALDKQDAQNIDFVSGATSTSYGYQESLQAALDKAKIS
jgi:uncharacterized protein with FMN-binding domain